MAVFDLEVDADRLDFRLMPHQRRDALLAHATVRRGHRLAAPHGYTVVDLDAGNWTGDNDLHRDMAAALGFPDYYGHNLDALNDCMRDVVDYRYGTTREAAGLVLAFAGYDTFARTAPRTAQIVLNIIADNGRCAMLTGHRILCLVQSSDPDITFAPVGATPVVWNHAEWPDAQRKPGSLPHRLLSE